MCESVLYNYSDDCEEVPQKLSSETSENEFYRVLSRGSPAPRTQPLARNLLVIARSTYCSCRNYREARSFDGSSRITDP